MYHCKLLHIYKYVNSGHSHHHIYSWIVYFEHLYRMMILQVMPTDLRGLECHRFQTPVTSTVVVSKQLCKCCKIDEYCIVSADDMMT